MRLLLGLIVAWAALNASLLASAMSDRLLPFGGYLFGASRVIGLAISGRIHAAVGGIATWTGINIFRIQCGRIVEVWSQENADSLSPRTWASCR